ncbi:MAG: DUF4339 domain-containing protein, partial [Bacteroidota bacterium]
NMMQNMNQQMMGGMNTPPPITVFYVAVNGQQTGPFNIQQLQQMLISGQFNAQSMVWKQGMSAWAAAVTIPDLSGLFNSMPPPPPPPPVS